MQHRLTQGMLHPAAEECPLNLTGAGEVVEIASADQVEQAIKNLLQEKLTRSFLSKVVATRLSGLAAETVLPQTVVLKLDGKIFQTLGGKDLDVAFRRAALGLKDSLESGKAPYLALLNGGRVVPMVLGFERVPDLKTHVIHQGRKGDEAFSYKDSDHPLSGEAGMGRLKEIELTGLADLATLCLGVYLKGIDLPVDIVIRLKARGREPASATYMAPEQLREFQATLQRSVQTYCDGHSVASESVSPDVADWPKHQLQKLNTHVRQLALGIVSKA